jgi:predicted CXXCH cytochrome family protein
MTFCITCHGINEKGHIVFENVHQGSYQVTDLGGSLDTYSLQCVECHDSRLYKPFGAGTWEHLTFPRFKHPVGVSLREIAAKRPREFNSPAGLPPETRLFDGKIGCGTCHNGYSKEKNMLVMNNYRSRLCMTCHIR